MASKQSNNPLSILYLEDDASFARKVKQKLIEDGFDINIELVKTCKEYFEQLQRHAFHMIFLDNHVADGTGIQALEAAKEKQASVPVIMFSDILDEVAIINSLRQGAVDYVLKTNLERLPEVVRNVLGQIKKHKTVINFEKFFTTSADLLCSCDKQGRFINLNPAWSKVLGYPKEALVGKPFLDFIYPDDRKTALSRFKTLFGADKNSGEFTGCFVSQSGDMRWLQWHTTVQSDEVIYAIARDFTELKQNEIKQSREQESLKQQIEEYKAEVTQKSIVANQIHDSVITTDLKGIITSWNNGSERVFGYSAEDAVGQHIALVYPEKDYKVIQYQGSNILLEQGSQELDIQMRRKSGEVFDARLTLAVTRDHSGEVNGMIGYAVDMGPVTTAGQNTVSNEQRLEFIIDNSPVVLFACGAQDNYRPRYVSPNVEVLFGYPVGRCTQEDNFLLNHCHPEDKDQLQNALDKVLETELFSHAYRFKKADGEYCWLHNELKLMRNSATNTAEIVGMLIDVDNLHHVQEQLQQLKQSAQQMEQQTEEARQQSQQWEQQRQQLEQSAQQKEQQLAEARQQFQQWEQQRQQLEQSAQQMEQQLQQAEQQIVRIEKELKAAMLLLDERQQQQHATREESMDSSAELNAALEQAGKATRAKSEFLAAISHELRVTLNAVLGFTQILALDETLGENNKQYLNEISGAGNHLLNIVNRLADIVDLETGNTGLARDNFDVLQLLEDCTQKLSADTHGKEVALLRSHTAADMNYQICGDRQRLQQVLSYVISSAVKNAPDDSRVEVVPEKSPGAVRIVIKNPAAGGNSGSKPPLAVEADLRQGRSNGFNNARIELLITQSLLELMGGSMRYEFDPEKVIAIIIPQTQGESTPRADSAVDKALAGRESPREKTILYLEDNAAAIRLIETLLKQRPGCRLVATRDPAQFEELAQRHDPCLILLDVNLPETGGYDLLEQWRRNAMMKDIPVVVIATDTRPEDIARAANAGAAEFLAKPIEIKRFLAVVDTFLAPQAPGVLKQSNTY
jgi:PAS domain S-box-containing protein